MNKKDNILKNSINNESEQERARFFEIQNILLDKIKTLENNNDKKIFLSKESEQEKIFLEYINNELEDKITEIVKDAHHLKYNLETKIKSPEELEQKNILLHECAESLTKKTIDLKRSKNKLNKKLEELDSLRESLQRKMFVEREKNQVTKTQTRITKYHVGITVAIIFMVAIIVPYFLYMGDLIGQEYRVSEVDQMKSGYIIQNLKGNTIDTWLSWRIPEGALLHVNILDTDKYPDKVDIIKKVILSEDVYEIADSLTGKGDAGDTSTYYPGWAGALNAASNTSTAFYIPKNLEIVDSGIGDITIKLVDYQSADGYIGFTKSISDEHQILKSEITIYNIDNLTKEQFSTILRHELGHAFGLSHSTASEDLMAPEMITEFPYISECDVDAIISLYNGGKSSSVICEK